MNMATVQIECEGGFPERFLNEAQKREIALWNITRRDISLFCYCRADEYLRLRPVAKLASVRMRVRKRMGLWFRIRPFRHRVGFVCGLVLFFAVLHLLSARVWIVRVSGNEQISETAIRDVLRPLGVYEGAMFDKVDLPNLQLTALEQLPQLVWLTVNQTGSVAYVEVRERTPSESIESREPSNIVAACDGVIVSIDCESGQAAVKVGDAVAKGDLLIGGVVDSKVGPLLKHAQGTVMARTERTITVTVPFQEETLSDSPETLVRPSLYVLGVRLPLYTSGEPWENSITTAFPLRAYGKALPIGIEIQHKIKQERITVVRNESEAYTEALARLSVAREEWEKTVSVEQERITWNKREDGWTVQGYYTCVEPIGRCQSLQMHEKKE